ncbi:MAG: peptidoglycan DD-metalloendopeptidase family protein [Clostridiales bacterium]|nr:peptidoglycan DD-metalloendopeptidase family protein [Clostridiales bacterium]
MVVSKLKYVKTFLSKKTKTDIITYLSVTAIALTVMSSTTIDGLGSYVNNPENAPVEELEYKEDSLEIVKYTGRVGTMMAQPVEEIIETTQDDISGFYVVVDNNVIGRVDENTKSAVEEYVNSLISSYAANDEAETVLLEEVTYSNGTFEKRKALEFRDITSKLDLHVKSTYTEAVTSEISFNTITTDSNDVFVGNTVVKTEGQTGTLQTTYLRSTINGASFEDTLQEETVIAPAVDKVILQGTRKTPSVSSDVFVNADGYIHPLGNAKCYVSSTFGYRTFDSSFHNGIDYAANSGTPIYAVSGGKVTYASFNDRGYGNYVTVDHGDGIITGYAHMSSISAKVGDTVSQGDVLGTVGTTGYSTGNHLHFSVRVNGEFVNPTNIVK